MPGVFSPSPRVSDPDMHHGTCVTHVPGCMPGSLTSRFLWSRWRRKRSRHSRRMRNPHFAYLVRGPWRTWHPKNETHRSIGSKDHRLDIDPCRVDVSSMSIQGLLLSALRFIVFFFALVWYQLILPTYFTLKTENGYDANFVVAGGGREGLSSWQPPVPPMTKNLASRHSTE